MDAITRVNAIRDQQAKNQIFYLLTEIQKLRDRVEELERSKQPTSAIGFHVKEGERHIETAFRTKTFKGGD